MNCSLRFLFITITCIVSFFSLLGLIIIAKKFGFSPADFHNEQKIFEPLTVVTVLSILFIPMAIASTSQVLVFKQPFWLIYFGWFLVTLILNSLSEELVYRVFPLVNISTRHFNKDVLVVFVTASLFSVAHFFIEEPDFLRFLYRFSFGTLAGLLFIKNRSLWEITGLHTGWNFIALTISDSDWRTGVLITALNFSPQIERGLNSAVLLMATVLLYLYVRRNKFEASLNS